MREDGRGSLGAATDADRCQEHNETRNRFAAPCWRRAGELFGRLPIRDFVACFAHPLSAYRLSGRKFVQLVKYLVNFVAFPYVFGAGVLSSE